MFTYSRCYNSLTTSQFQALLYSTIQSEILSFANSSAYIIVFHLTRRSKQSLLSTFRGKSTGSLASLVPSSSFAGTTSCVSMANANRKWYSAVHCCILSWRETDLNSEEQISCLEELLSDGFHYSVARCRIPFFGSREYVEAKMERLVAEHGSDSDKLVIIYYSGHGGLQRGTPDQMYWSAQVRLLHN